MRLIAFALLCVLCAGQAPSAVPPEAKFKARYVNPVPRPEDFTSAMLWGIAIADSRVAGYEHAKVEILQTRLTCRVDGKDVVLNNDSGEVRGGLYRRDPWFGTDAHDPMPVIHSSHNRTVVLAVGTRPDKVWHFWAASPRVEIPGGKLDGCSVNIRAKVSRGALLQVGFDYWRNAKVEYGLGGNNHEAGASDWYLPSDQWQDAEFTDITR